MRTTVIPAQITTVEDRIVASLNLTQIILLLSSLFVATFIYATFPPSLTFSIYKIPLFILTFTTFGALALRIKGKVVINWLLILSIYYLRPQYYVYNKNDLTTRTIGFVVKKNKAHARARAKVKEVAKTNNLSISDLVQIETALANPKTSFSVKFRK